MIDSTKLVSVDIMTPRAGFYRMRLRRRAHPVGIRIWHGPPHDPLTGEVMDRSWRWQATANNRPIDLDRVWPVCAREPIDEAEHDRLCARQAWGEAYAPGSPEANPMQSINLLTAPIPI
jgi:hypothetical protein